MTLFSGLDAGVFLPADELLTRRPGVDNYRVPVEYLTGDVYHVANYGATGDGTTDDSAAIQSAIDAANTAGSGIVMLAANTYALAETLTMKSNVKLCGVGDASVLKATGALNSASGLIMATASSSRFEICDLTIDGNASAFADATAGHGIYLASCSYVALRRLNFRNIGYSKSGLRACMNLQSTCTDVFIDEPRGISVQATPTLWYGLYNYGAARTWLRNPYFYGFGDEPVVFYNSQDFLWQGGRVCYGADNTAGNGAHGCHITATSGTTTGLVWGVEADHNYDDGFRIDEGASGITSVSVIGCNAHDNGNVGVSCDGQRSLLQGNRCYGNTGGATGAGIWIAAPNCVAVANYCYNNGITGINVASGGTDTLLIGNMTGNTSGTAQNYGVLINTGVSEVVMIGNGWAGSTANIQLDGTGAATSLFDWFGSGLNVSGLPTADPTVAGRPWLNSNVLTISAG